MKFRAMRVRIGRLAVERPADDGVTVTTLTDAVESELAVRMLEQPSTRPSGTTPPLAGVIADGIANKLGWGVRR